MTVWGIKFHIHFFTRTYARIFTHTSQCDFCFSCHLLVGLYSGWSVLLLGEGYFQDGQGEINGLLMFILSNIQLGKVPRTHSLGLFRIPNKMLSVLLILGSYRLQSCREHRISKSWIIAPKGNVGLGSCEPLVTLLSWPQFITLFYWFYPLRTPYLM